MTVEVFCRAVAELGRRHGGSVTSWGRTVRHNVEVGGVIGSPHVWWVAADLVWDAPPDRPTVDADAARLGLQVIWESDHAHVQPAGWHNAPPPTAVV